MYECKMKEQGRGNEKIEGRVGGERKVTEKERREDKERGRQGRKDRRKEKETDKRGKRDRNCLVLNLRIWQWLRIGKEVLKANHTHYFLSKLFPF